MAEAQRGLICPRARIYGKHNWHGWMLSVDAWAVMECRNCGQWVLHDLSGKARRGPQR